jgi:hypothetical protein
MNREAFGALIAVRSEEGRPMAVVVVREASRVGACHVLGELVYETATRFFYRPRSDGPIAFVNKRSPSIHVKACRTCSDYGERD